MSMKRTMGMLAAAITSALVLSWTTPATAGHYDLTDVEELVSAKDRQKLAKAAISTTLDLFNQTARKKDRQKVAKVTGIAMKRLVSWAHFCDLLRIDGVGPTMARLLQAANVMNVESLRREDAKALLVRVTAANKTTRITELLPGEEHLRTWIERAKKLPLILE